MKNTILLVIDDESDTANWVKMVCEHFINHFEVAVCLDPEIALNVAKVIHPDTILIDLTMPRMDGWTVLDIFRKDDEFKDIPIAIHSARTQTFDEMTMSPLRKVDAYISKPPGIISMIEGIKSLLPNIQTNIEYERRIEQKYNI